MGCLTAKLTGKFWRYYIPNEHIHLFTPRALNLLLKQEGFNSIKYKSALYEDKTQSKAYFSLTKQLLWLCLKWMFIRLPFSVSFWKINTKKWKNSKVRIVTQKDGLILIAKKGSIDDYGRKRR